jgi:hypothetical protein
MQRPARIDRQAGFFAGHKGARFVAALAAFRERNGATARRRFSGRSNSRTCGGGVTERWNCTCTPAT